MLFINIKDLFIHLCSFSLQVGIWVILKFTQCSQVVSPIFLLVDCDRHVTFGQASRYDVHIELQNKNASQHSEAHKYKMPNPNTPISTSTATS